MEYSWAAHWALQARPRAARYTPWRVEEERLLGDAHSPGRVSARQQMRVLSSSCVGEIFFAATVTLNPQPRDSGGRLQHKHIGYLGKDVPGDELMPGNESPGRGNTDCGVGDRDVRIVGRWGAACADWGLERRALPLQVPAGSTCWLAAWWVACCQRGWAAAQILGSHSGHSLPAHRGTTWDSPLVLRVRCSHASEHSCTARHQSLPTRLSAVS